MKKKGEEIRRSIIRKKHHIKTKKYKYKKRTIPDLMKDEWKKKQNQKLENPKSYKQVLVK